MKHFSQVTSDCEADILATVDILAIEQHILDTNGW
jgi:hypothetical protein